MKKILFLCFLVFAQVDSAHAGLSDKVRPLVEKYLGQDIANRFFGLKETIKIPAIPKLSSDSKSTAIYDNQHKETVTFSKEEMTKYNIGFVQELLEATRETKANRNEIAKWMGTLNQGASREGVYRALVLDAYYSRMENYNTQLSKPALDFSLRFLKKYTGQEVEASKLSSFNIYTVKRIVTERALEILDAYLATNKDGFYDWYAVLSSELAGNHKIWGNRLRSNKLAVNHRKWAKQMPVQFVKSEVIIKLHTLFNSLQKRN